MSQQPLDGVRIVELSTMITASLAAMMMAEQGASVVKVEPLEAGDPMRYLGTSKGGMSGLFANCNRGKRSVRVNVKVPQGRDVVARLAADADVLIHNFRPGVMDGLALGSDALREANPRLVYVAISGFGTAGPMRSAPAYDPVVQAHAGFATLQGTDKPEFVRNLMCDKITAYTACQATTAALLQRERSGVGQHIDVSMLDASLAFLYPDGFMNHTLLDDDAQQQPLLADQIYNPVFTRDGALTVSAATQEQRNGMFRAVGRAELAEDERFASLEAMLAHIDEFQQIITDAFGALDSDEAVARLLDNDVPCAKCLSADEVVADEQLAANDSLRVIDHPVMGRLRIMLPPAKFGGVRLDPGSPSPSHGEQTVAVLAELGIDETEVVRLREAGVVE